MVRHSAARAAALALLTTAVAACGLALPAALGRALDLLLSDPDGTSARRWTLVCVALTFLLVVLGALDDLLSGTTTARATAWARRRLLRHTLAVGPRATRRLAPGDLVTRLVGNAAHAGAAPTALAASLAAVVTPVGGLVALALIDPWLCVAFLAGLPLLAVLLKSFVRDTTDSVARYQDSQGEIAGRLMEALHGARTIAAAGTAGRERDRVLGPLPELSRQGHRMWRIRGRSAAQAAALVPLLEIAVLAVAGVRLTAGGLSVGGLLAASRYAVLATGFGTLVGHLSGLVRARTAARRFADVLAEPAAAYGARRLPPDGPGTVELRGVNAARGGRPVLSGVDLVVPGGRSVAVVGRSGAGKSVLAALAGRLADPDSGQVLLDGVPLTDLGHDELRGSIGYAFERPALLGGTIGGTIALGVAEPPPARVTAAARAACADDFVRRLPDGYATPCADAPLSGGEAQRLGLARAFAHPGRLLILDDATSSLDTVTERRVSGALAGRPDAPARTRLIVAHRAATAARADLVAWLEDGRVRAVGPHAELWRDPHYRAVFASPDAPAASLDAPGAFPDPPGTVADPPHDAPGAHSRGAESPPARPPAACSDRASGAGPAALRSADAAD
ncbi:ABC transporter ATP-binding protein, partial [Streptomyces sp. B1866]|uniref:ABC transporter ATP-binding protein n=1 Tax=Streptomyces sp. B1866 TaxID=3075431 RepID=UPI00288D3185